MQARPNHVARVLSASALAIAASSAVFAQRPDASATAQQAEQGSAAGIQDIVVTARRVEENLQQVPVTVTAVSAERIARADIRDLFTLTKEVPSLTLCCGPGGALSTSVRGVKNGAPAYFADVPIGLTGFTSFFDIQSVQVLKGPQGTLFGQASNGGAIVIEPRRPGDELGGYVTASVGTYNRRELLGALDVPLFDGRAKFRLAAQSFYRAGYIRDVSTGARYAGSDFVVLRPSVTLKISDTIENYTLFQYSKSKTRGNASVLSDFNMRSVDQGIAASGGTFAACRAAGNLYCVPVAFNGGTPQAFNALRDQVLATQIALGPYRMNGYSTGCAVEGQAGNPGPIATGVITTLSYSRAACVYNRTEDWFGINTTSWNIAKDWTIKNILGLRGGKSFTTPGDNDNTPLIIQDLGSPSNNYEIKTPTTFSQEFQVQGRIWEKVDLTVGSFYTRTHNHPAIVYANTFGSTSASIAKTSSWSHGLYGQANIDLGNWIDGLVATAGYRHTKDVVNSLSRALNPVTGAVSRVVGGPNSPAGRAKFNAGSYTLQLKYQVSRDTMIYVNNSKGYGSGGLQNVVGFEQFKPDALTNYETGFKTTFPIGGMKARINAAAYYGNYDDIKVTVSSIATNPVTGVTSSVIATRNAASARLKGGEIEATLVVTSDLQIGGWASYADYKYIRFPSVNQVSPGVFVPIDLSNSPFTVSPKSKWNIHGTYHFPVDQDLGDISFTASYTHTGKWYLQAKPFVATNPANPDQTGIVCSHTRTAANGYGPLSADGKTVPVDCNPSRGNLDISLDWSRVMGRDGLSASFILTNVTKNIQGDGGASQNNTTGVTAPTPAIPRMFVVKLTYEY